MKKLMISTVIGLASILLFGGCVAAIGNSPGKSARTSTTLGQELIDLQRAKDAGALSEAEYQAERTRLLEHK